MISYFELIKEAVHALDTEVSIFTRKNIKDYISEKYPDLKINKNTVDSIIQGMTYNSAGKRKLSKDKRILKRIDHGYYMLYIM